MHKSFLYAILFLFLLAQGSYAADTVLQAVGLGIDKKSANYNIDRILKKVVMSVAVSNSRVKIYSVDKADLEFSGINDLNGKVLMKAVKKAGFYQLELYRADDEKTNVLFNDSVRLYLKNFGDTVDDIARQVVSNIAVQYPPKPLRELTSINIVRVKLSEYESQNGYWSVGVIPSYNIMDLRCGVTKASNSSGNYEKTFQNRGGSVNVEGVYRIQQWTFIVGVAGSMGGWNETPYHASFNDLNFNGTAGYGLFGSLFVIGLDVALNLGNYRTDFISYDTYTNLLVVPDISYRSFQLNLFLQINISKDYNITFSAGPPIPLDFFNHIELDFNKNGKYPDYANVTVPATWMFGLPQIKLSLNFRLFPNWWLRVYYDIFGPSFNKYENNVSHHVPVDNIGLFELDAFSISKTKIGLGLFYAF
jgi:hypothetical protein